MRSEHNDRIVKFMHAAVNLSHALDALELKYDTIEYTGMLSGWYFDVSMEIYTMKFGVDDEC